MIPKIVKENPFRILGCFSNCTAKERISNKGRLAAFARVNKVCDFPSDMKDLLGEVTRTPEIITEAEQALNLQEDQLRNALFWFVKASPLDQIALGHASVGSIEKAEEIWNKRDCWSSSLNLGVLALINESLDEAVDHLTNLVHDSEKREQFLAVFGLTDAKVNESQLAIMLINGLHQSYSWTDLLESFDGYGNSYEDDEYIQTEALKEPVRQINEAIQKAQSGTIDPDSASTRCRNLIAATSQALSFFTEYVDDDSIHKQMACDKLAQTLCWLADKITDDRTDNVDAIKSSRMYTEKALEIAVGDAAIEKCQKALSNIENMLKMAELGPVIERVTSHGLSLFKGSPSFKDIEDYIAEVRHAIEVVRSKCGSEEIETLTDSLLRPTVNAIIDVVNKAQANKEVVLSGLRNGTLLFTVDQAISLFKNLKSFPISADFRKRIDLQYAASFKLRAQIADAQQRVRENSRSGSGWLIPTLLVIGFFLLYAFLR